MPGQSSFDYAIVRLVPYVERGEFVNVGVILFCRIQHFLAARVELNQERILTLAPNLDISATQNHLDLIPRICAGGPKAGPLGTLSQTERFHWLVSPRSSVVQVSPVHTGFCTNPQATLNDLFTKLVKGEG